MATASVSYLFIFFMYFSGIKATAVGAGLTVSYSLAVKDH